MKTILVVEDDVYIGDMLEEALRKEGYDVSRAYSGSEALLRLPGGRPDLVLLDLMLRSEWGRGITGCTGHPGYRCQCKGGNGR